MPKRYITAKPGELKAAFGKGERWDAPAIQYAYGGQGASKPDGRVLAEAIEGMKVFGDKTLAAELAERGYDLSTLKFSIQQTKAPTPPPEGKE